MFLPFDVLNSECGAAGPASTPGHRGQEEQEQEQEGGSSPVLAMQVPQHPSGSPSGSGCNRLTARGAVRTCPWQHMRGLGEPQAP